MDSLQEIVPNNNYPEIAILILNWNNYPDTRICLESLEKLSYPAFKIILVDNGSSDGSREKLREEFPELTLLESDRNLGFAGGNNIGLRYILEVGIPYTLLLNNDTEVIQPDFLEQILRVMDGDREVCAVGPKVVRENGEPDQVILPFPSLDMTLRNSLGLYRQRLEQKQTVDSLIGCCVLVRNQAVRQVGLLDENYFMYVEETEWFYRMRKQGWSVLYYPVESVIHKGGSSAKKLEDSQVYVERRSNVIYTLVKHGYLLQAGATGLFMLLMLVFRVVTDYFRPNLRRERYTGSIFSAFISAVSRKVKLARRSGV